MKPHTFFTTAGIFALILLFSSRIVFSQDLYTETWKGTFMNDFTMTISIHSTQKNEFSGKINMFSGPNQIQNDELSKIMLSDTSLSFYIQAKETEFHGSFNPARTSLAGSFIFPDKSEHPVFLERSGDDPQEDPGDMNASGQMVPKYFSPEQMKEDLDYLSDLLEEYHPRLRRQEQGKRSVPDRDRVKEQISSRLDLEGFYQLVAPFMEQVRCSHTGVRLPGDYLNAIHAYGNFFPLKIRIKEDRAFVTGTYDEHIPQETIGSEILRINRFRVDEILQNLKAMIPAEGANRTHKLYELNRNFPEYFYFLDRSESFDLSYRKDGLERSIKLKACSYSEIEAQNRKVGPEAPFDNYLDGQNGVDFLRIHSFEIVDMDEYFQMLDSIFKALREQNIQTLVLDIRDNPGGHPIFAAQLFSYLTDHDFTYFKENPDIPDFAPLYQPMHANPEHFSGNLYVFVNGGCLSTTGHLISLLKYHTKAVFLGEEPGSTYYCCDFSIQKTLPHTGLEVNIPRSEFETAVPDFDKKFTRIVDYPVDESMNDMIAGKDGYYDFFYDSFVK